MKCRTMICICMTVQVSCSVVSETDTATQDVLWAPHPPARGAEVLALLHGSTDAKLGSVARRDSVFAAQTQQTHPRQQILAAAGATLLSAGAMRCHPNLAIKILNIILRILRLWSSAMVAHREMSRALFFCWTTKGARSLYNGPDKNTGTSSRNIGNVLTCS